MRCPLFRSSKRPRSIGTRLDRRNDFKRLLRGESEMSSVRATMIGLYPNPELKGVAEEVEATLKWIMEEAAG